MAIEFGEALEEERIVSSTLTHDDEQEGGLRPKLLHEYTGQEKAKDNLQVYIQAAKLRAEPLDHVLLYGPPGLGKTTLSGIIANEMGVNIRITSGPAIAKAGDLAAVFEKSLLLYTKKGAAAACRRIAKRIQGLPEPMKLRKI